MAHCRVNGLRRLSHFQSFCYIGKRLWVPMQVRTANLLMTSVQPAPRDMFRHNSSLSPHPSMSGHLLTRHVAQTKCSGFCVT